MGVAKRSRSNKSEASEKTKGQEEEEGCSQCRKQLMKWEVSGQEGVCEARG